MALSKNEKKIYDDEITHLKKDVEDLKKKINDIAIKKKKHKNISSYLNIEGAMLLMQSIGINCTMSNMSFGMLGIRNNKFLDNAKSDFSKLLLFLGEIVGTEVDRSPRSNDEYLATISQLNPAQILQLVRDVHATYRNMKESYGQDTKWKWQFVEFYAKMAAITKNITNFSEVAKLRDPRTEYFRERKELMTLCKEVLAESAKQYRTKYELSGKAREDLQKTIDYLSALRQIHTLFGEANEAEKLRTTIEANQQTLAAGDSSKDKQKKK